MNIHELFDLEDTNPNEADKCYRAIIEDNPNNEMALFNYGVFLQKHGRYDKSVICFDKIVNLNPKDTQARKALANILLDLGDAAAASVHFRLSGDMHQRLVAACHLADDNIVEKLHNEWGKDYKSDIALPNTDRIAYISPDFKSSTVVKFFLPVLTKNDYCYSDCTAKDNITAEVEAKCGKFIDISAMSDDEVLKQFEKDEIGIVVDLCGHFDGGKRLNLIARLNHSYSYIRYPRPTGLPNQLMINDRVINAGGMQLTCGSLAYACDSIAPIPKRDKRVYGSTNRPAKFDDELLQSWVKIIRESGGHLKLLVPSGESNWVLRQKLEKFGMPSDKLALVPTGEGYWDFLQSIDCLLDAKSYSGVTTVADSLWVGVPVVTWSGNSPQGRMGTSIMHRAGLSESVAHSSEEYVRIALGEQLMGGRLSNQARDLLDGKEVVKAIERAVKERI